MPLEKGFAHDFDLENGILPNQEVAYFYTKIP